MVDTHRMKQINPILFFVKAHGMYERHLVVIMLSCQPTVYFHGPYLKIPFVMEKYLEIKFSWVTTFTV